MTRTLIRVTREDIRYGVKGSSSCCPVALATKRTLQLATCAVDEQITGWGAATGAIRGKAPRSVLRFINKFDTGGKPRPFRFYLVTS